MPNNFFDTSALGKHYHPEVGTPKVDALLREPSSQHFISRLGAVEMLSVFAGKVRAGVLTLPAFDILRRRFLTDLTNRLLQAIRMTGFHYDEAQRLVRQHGPSRRLRTLDALQLAVALDLRSKGALAGRGAESRTTRIETSTIGHSASDDTPSRSRIQDNKD